MRAREEALELAKTLTTESREQEYGSAFDNFTTISKLWNAAFGWEVRVSDVPLAMDLVKTARLATNPKHYDSWVYKAGYSALGAELVSE